MTDRGVSDFDILTSVNMIDWTTALSDAYLQKQNVGYYGVLRESESFSLDAPIVARYVKLDLKDNHGDAVIGLSEVKFTGSVIPEPSSLAMIGLVGGCGWFAR